MNFPNDTSIADAKAQVLALLPTDTAVTYFGVDSNNGSCGQWNLRSPILAQVFGSPKIGDPQGDVGVDFFHLDASGTSVYDPSNIQAAIVSILPGSPTLNC